MYQEWNKQPEFKAAFEQAAEDATDLLEEEARRRAIEGVPEPHFYEGWVRVVQKYSDSLLMFLLKGKREAYREKRSFGVGVESQGVTGGLRKVIVEIDESPGAGA
jgi:hypothetical protein